MNRQPVSVPLMIMAVLFTLGAFGMSNAGGIGVKIHDDHIENVIGRCCQYVAMYNANNRLAQVQGI